MSNPAPVTGRRVTRADFNDLGAAVAGLETAVGALEAAPPGSVTGDGLSILGFDQDGTTISIPFVTPQMFGAVGDGVTDDGPAFAAAIEYLRANATLIAGIGEGAGGGRLLIPRSDSFYWLNTTTLDIFTTLIIEGECGAGTGPSTILRWADGTTGIRIQAYNTTGSSSVRTDSPPVGYCGAGTIIQNLHLRGGYDGTEGEYHGIHIRNRCMVRNVVIERFSGDGIYAHAAAGVGAPLEGNANCSRIEHVEVYRCRNGVFLKGADANACILIGLNTRSNRAWGVFDQSFLGNTYVGCHCSANGWAGANIGSSLATGCSYNGNIYAVIFGQEAWCSTNPPTGTTSNNQGWQYQGAGGPYGIGLPLWVSGTVFRTGGAYCSSPAALNSVNQFVGCYAESDQCMSQFGPRALVIGGMHAPGIMGGGNIGVENGQITVNDLRSGADVSFARSLLFPGGQYKFDGSDYTMKYLNSGSPANQPFRISRTGETHPIGEHKMIFPAGAGFSGPAKWAGGAEVSDSGVKVAGTKVVGAQGAAVADATDAASVITQLNTLLARMRAHGLIAS